MSDTSKRQTSTCAQRPQEGTTLVANDDFVERVRAMKSSERVGFMVSAGINKPNGKLTDRYRD